MLVLRHEKVERHFKVTLISSRVSSPSFSIHSLGKIVGLLLNSLLKAVFQVKQRCGVGLKERNNSEELA